MKIEAIERDNATVLRLEGKIDANSSPDLEKQITEVIENTGEAVILDFSPAVYISSAGLRVLLAAAKKLNAKHRSFLLCGVNETIMKVFKMTGFQLILEIHEDLEQALETLS